MSKLARTTIIIMMATIISKVLGFTREVVLAANYGTSIYSDAYLISITIPTVMFVGISSALGNTYIPFFYKIKEQNNENKAIEFTNNLTNIVIIICIFLSIVFVFDAKNIVNLFAVGFEGEVFNLAIKFTRILIPGIIFTGITNILIRYLNVNDSFIIPSLISVPYSIIIIISIFLSSKINIYILVYGTLLGIISQFVFQILFAYKKGYKYRLHIDIKDENIKELVKLTIPVFLGISVNQINTLVDRTIASTLVEGSISSLNYANKLNGFVMGIFVSSIVTVIYPMLSSLSAKNDIKSFKKSVQKSVNSILIIVFPIAIGAMALSTPIVKLLFQRGSFDLRATQMTSIALFYYSIGMIGFGLRDVLSRVFYSLQDTKTPMINGAMAMILNIILNLILVKNMAHAGLALSTSISELVGTGLLFYSLRKKIGSFSGRNIVSVMVKVSISSIIMGVVVKSFYNFINSIIGSGFIFEAIGLGSSIIIGAFVYLGLIFILKIEEVNIFIYMIKTKIKKIVA